MHLDAEITPESYGGFISRAFLLREGGNKLEITCFSIAYKFTLNERIIYFLLVKRQITHGQVKSN